MIDRLSIKISGLQTWYSDFGNLEPSPAIGMMIEGRITEIIATVWCFEWQIQQPRY